MSTTELNTISHMMRVCVCIVHILFFVAIKLSAILFSLLSPFLSLSVSFKFFPSNVVHFLCFHLPPMWLQWLFPKRFLVRT